MHPAGGKRWIFRDEAGVMPARTGGVVVSSRTVGTAGAMPPSEADIRVLWACYEAGTHLLSAN